MSHITPLTTIRTRNSANNQTVHPAIASLPPCFMKSTSHNNLNSRYATRNLVRFRTSVFSAIFAVVLVLCSACKVTRFEYTKDGVTVRATDARFLLRSAGKISVEPQTNNYPRLTVEAESSVESQAFHAFGR